MLHYDHEMAEEFKEFSSYVCLDDKYRFKIDQLSFSVIAAEHRRTMLVSIGSSFEDGAHNFTIFGLIPSVSSGWYCTRVQ